jgi:hypothetical protein
MPPAPPLGEKTRIKLNHDIQKWTLKNHEVAPHNNMMECANNQAISPPTCIITQFPVQKSNPIIFCQGISVRHPVLSGIAKTDEKN